MSSQDWDVFAPTPVGPKPSPEQRKAHATEQWRVDSAIARTFNTPDGRVALQWLRDRTIEQPAFVPGLDPSHGFAREGQNSLVREIEKRIRRAADGPPAILREEEKET